VGSALRSGPRSVALGAVPTIVIIAIIIAIIIIAIIIATREKSVNINEHQSIQLTPS
jgi:hypothetical protein